MNRTVSSMAVLVALFALPSLASAQLPQCTNQTLAGQARQLHAASTGISSSFT